MNSVIMNDHVQGFAWTHICIFLGHEPGIGIAGHMVSHCLIF